MSDDPFKMFEDLGVKDWPGSKPPVNRPSLFEEVPRPKPEDAWDYKPVVFVYGGRSREFFTIRHLSAALNRSPVTIRGWENKGLLPKSPYRSPAPKRATLPDAGPPKGKRLWTRAQIEGLLRIAAQSGCIVDEKQSKPNEEFTLKATELFLTLMKEEENVN